MSILGRLCIIAVATLLATASDWTTSTITLAQETETAKGEPLNYELRLVPRADRTDLLVALRLRTADDAPLAIGLPKDTAFGTPDLSRYVTAIEGLGGTTLRPGADTSTRIAHPGRGGEVHLQYTLSFPPNEFGDGTYAPNSGSGYLYVAGAQWLLRIGDPSTPRPYVIGFHELPPKWRAYSSLGSDPKRIDVLLSHKRLSRSALGAVRDGFTTFTTQQSPVSVFIAPDFADRRAMFAQAIESIVRAQRKAFDDYSAPFFNIVVLPRPNNVAGIKSGQQFTCFMRQDITRQQLTVLLAHEMMHSWITDRVFRVGPADERAENFVRNMWFIEGVNEYLARITLRNAGMLSPSDFADLVNRDLTNLADNPHRHETFDEVMQAANTGKFGVAYTKLSYYRGALIALNWEARLRAANSETTVLSAIRDLYRRVVHEETISYDLFFEALDAFGLDARQDFQRHILQGLPIEPRPDALGAAFELQATDVPSFLPGFAVRSSRNAGSAIDVIDGGAAHRAGLRNGMPVTSIENATRFGNAWDPNAPLTVVTRENGVARRISFFPHGKLRELKLFQGRPGSPADE